MTVMQPITAKPDSVTMDVTLDQIAESADFKFRADGIDATHKADLASTIRNTGAPLDPVLLWRAGPGEIGAAGKLILLDGAHRLAAYRAVKWSQPIPAVILVGTDRRDALGAALRANSKRTMGLSQAERMDAAWRLVREPVQRRYKVREIAAWADVARATVDNMRARFRVMHEEGIEITGSWARDRRTRDEANDGGLGQMTDAQRKVEIGKLAGDIRELLDRRKHPERPILREQQAVWEAIGEALGDNALKQMLDYLLGGAEEANEWLALARSSGDEAAEDAEDDDPDPQF